MTTKATTKAARPLSRKSKAITLVPLALLSGVWTASLLSSSATATMASSSDNQDLPDGTSVPSQAIEAPASVPVPGVVAPAVPEGSEDQLVAGASSSGIPAPALAAYQRAAQIINSADKSCNIPWELIAAIGRVESDHGRYGGNTLTNKGVSIPGVYGIELNGKNGTQAVNDTDGGQLDKDPVYDRAVGAMQFIPSTWQVVKVDADGDGQRNPQDIDDSSLATGVYLCSGSDNLGNRAGQESAVYRYNHSKSYVNLVLRLMEAYMKGDYTAVPSGVYGGTSFSTSYAHAIAHKREVVREHRQEARQREQARLLGSSGGGSGGGGGATGGTTTTAKSPVTKTTSSGGDVVGDTLKKVGGTVTGSTGGTTSGSGGTATTTLTKSEKCLKSLGLAITTDPKSLTGTALLDYTKCMAS